MSRTLLLNEASQRMGRINVRKGGRHAPPEAG
jgi:hypothetical protein